MTKVVYVARVDPKIEYNSVIKKILEQIKGFEQNGVQVTLLTFGYNGFPNTLDSNHIDIAAGTNPGSTKFQKFLTTGHLHKQILDAVKCEAPDIIYLRDCQYRFNLHKELSKIAPLFVEIQTNVFSELKLTSRPRYYFELGLRRRYLRFSSGLVCITNEIANVERKYNNKPVLILGNGIDEGRINFAKKNEQDNYINLVFIGTPNQPWHGLDRLIKSYLIAPNRERFILHIVGNENDMGISDKNVRFYGYIEGREKLEQIMSISDIGIGSLALYKKKMNEAAPLKVRNYIASGLPVVIGYKDVDLDDNLPFVLRFPNDSSPLDFVLLEDFYYRTLDLRRSGEITAFAANLTWKRKMRLFLTFAEPLIRSDLRGII